MNRTGLLCCCIAALVPVPFLVLNISVTILFLVNNMFRGLGTTAFLPFGTFASMGACYFSIGLLFLLIVIIMDSFREVPDNWDQRRGFDHAPSQDDLRLDRTRRLVRELEEERKQILQGLFELFPSVSYTSQGIGSESGDCAICLGDFKEGDLCWVIPSCKHVFHSSCISRWLMIRFCCPVCRHSISLG